jgi:putative DNA primase/helicase
LDSVAAAVRRHVVLQPAAADAVALWITHTWVYERFDHSPRLGITSPTRRCGKSTLLEVLRITCRRTLKADNISASGVFRTIEAARPLTLLTDEADSFLKENEELRGVLNSGFEKTGQVVRVVEIDGEHQPVAFATFAPVALAAIGELPSTLSDRSIPIRMERKAPAERVQKMRAGRNREALGELARMLARWSHDFSGVLPTDPPIPDALNDREGDIAVPLLAIADHAAKEWAGRARRALLAVFGLRAEHDGNLETGALLLADLRALFVGTSSLKMTSADLCARLCQMDERPWPEWRQGKPMTPRQLAVALSPFGIRPATVHLGHEQAKGYVREAFQEAWARYLPAEAPAPLPPDTLSTPSPGGLDPYVRTDVDGINGFDKNRSELALPPLRIEKPQTCSLEQHPYGRTDLTPPDRCEGHIEDEIRL